MTSFTTPSRISYCLLLLVPLSWLIAGGWELLPIVVAIIIATTVSALIFIIRANRLLQIGTKDYLSRVILPGLPPYLIGILVAIPVTMLARRP
jgi:hypothetical protein